MRKEGKWVRNEVGEVEGEEWRAAGELEGRKGGRLPIKIVRASVPLPGLRGVLFLRLYFFYAFTPAASVRGRWGEGDRGAPLSAGLGGAMPDGDRKLGGATGGKSKQLR